MMKTEFLGNIELLNSAFGGNSSYNDHQMMMLWDRVKDINVWEFKTAINNVMEAATTRSLPMPGVLINACRPAIIRAINQKTALKLKQLKLRDGNCKWCGHTGSIMAAKKGSSHISTSFRCTKCEAADILGLSKSGFHPWNDMLLKNWEPTKYERKKRSAEDQAILKKCKMQNGAINISMLLALTKPKDNIQSEPQNINSPEWNEWFDGLPEHLKEEVRHRSLDDGSMWDFG